MTNMQLTPGAIGQLRKMDVAPPGWNPVVQCITVTAFQPNKYKMTISDGSSTIMAMLASQLGELVKKNEVKENTLMRLMEIALTKREGAEPYVVVLRLEVLGTPGTVLGNPSVAPVQQPVQVSSGSNRVVAAPVYQQPPAQPMYQQQQQPAQPMYQHQPSAYQQQQQQAVAQPMYQQQQQQPMYQQVAQAPTQPAYQQQGRPMSAASHGAVAPLQNMIGNRAMPRTIPIKLLNPYQNKWTIKARVTSKAEIKTWDKGPTNSGKLFSADLVDNEGGEIRATFFREAVDMFYDALNVGQVYLFSEGRVKIANRQFSAIKNEYELNFGKEGQVTPAQDDGDIARINLQPVAISELNGVEPKTTVDIVGIATEIGEVNEFQSKAGKDLKKMEIQLVDRSNASVRLSVWGQKADEILKELRNSGPNPVIAIKGVQVGDYGGRSLSTISSTTMLVNPVDVPAAGQLRSWFDQGNGRSGVSQLTAGKGEGGAGGGSRGPAPVKDRVTLEGIKAQGLGRNGQQDFCDVKGYLMFVKRDNLWYPACRTDKCAKKMTKNPADDKWFCERCNLAFEEPEYRYIASFQIADSTGSIWCTAFNEAANAVFGGISAQELEMLKRDNEPEFNRRLMQSSFQEGIFTLKVKEEMYQNQMTTKCNIIAFKPIDNVFETKELLKAIEQYESGST